MCRSEDSGMLLLCRDEDSGIVLKEVVLYQ
jgi:hypothetical protein